MTNYCGRDVLFAMSPHELAEKFLLESSQFRLGGLTTETPHPLTNNLSALAKSDPAEALKLFAKVEITALEKMREYKDQIDRLARDIKSTLDSGGRIFFGGCGATGRLALTIEWLWPVPGNVFGFMAGGDYALVRSIESFEDHPEYGARQLDDLGFKPGDLFVGVTEGGETPFVIGATLRAAELSPGKSFFLFCNPVSQLMPFERCKQVLTHPSIHKFSFEIGPMALCGSTRLQATSCLTLAAGAALLSAYDGKNFETRFGELINTLKETDFSRAKDVCIEEFSRYEQGETFTHSSLTHALSLATDVTERSPTFSLFPLENDRRGDSWKSWAYPHVPNTHTSEEAWQKLLHRRPRPLTWKGFEAYGMDTVLGFDFSKVRSNNVFSLEADPKEIVIKANDQTAVFKSHPDPLVEALLVKALLNAISTVGMGRLGRYEGNLMLWVRASNYKLVDRASRYVSHLLQKNGRTAPYEKIVRTLFECQKDLGQGEPIVMKTADQLR